MCVSSKFSDGKITAFAAPKKIASSARLYQKSLLDCVTIDCGRWMKRRGGIAVGDSLGMVKKNVGA